MAADDDTGRCGHDAPSPWLEHSSRASRSDHAFALAGRSSGRLASAAPMTFVTAPPRAQHAEIRLPAQHLAGEKPEHVDVAGARCLPRNCSGAM